jgi:hypothetical protein
MGANAWIASLASSIITTVEWYNGASWDEYQESVIVSMTCSFTITNKPTEPSNTLRKHI